MVRPPHRKPHSSSGSRAGRGRARVWAGSPIVDGDGAVVADRRIMADGAPARLCHCLGSGFVLVVPEADVEIAPSQIPLRVVTDASLTNPILVRPEGHLAARLASVSEVDAALERATAAG